MLAKPGASVTRSETADVPPTEDSRCATNRGLSEPKHGIVLVMLTKDSTTMTQMQVMQEPERVARPTRALIEP